MTAATVLILGGTGEAREVAGRLTGSGTAGLRVVLSLAGPVRPAAWPAGEVRAGGFGGVPGLVAWLAGNGVTAVVDATHPFAATMRAHAVAASAVVPVPLLRVLRAPWAAAPGDRWHPVGSEAEAGKLTSIDRPPSAGRVVEIVAA